MLNGDIITTNDWLIFSDNLDLFKKSAVYLHFFFTFKQ